jgi:hypothetical protein
MIVYALKVSLNIHCSLRAYIFPYSTLLKPT